MKNNFLPIAILCLLSCKKEPITIPKDPNVSYTIITPDTIILSRENEYSLSGYFRITGVDTLPTLKLYMSGVPADIYIRVDDKVKVMNPSYSVACSSSAPSPGEYDVTLIALNAYYMKKEFPFKIIVDTKQ